MDETLVINLDAYVALRRWARNLPCVGLHTRCVRMTPGDAQTQLFPTRSCNRSPGAAICTGVYLPYSEKLFFFLFLFFLLFLLYFRFTQEDPQWQPTTQRRHALALRRLLGTSWPPPASKSESAADDSHDPHTSPMRTYGVWGTLDERAGASTSTKSRKGEEKSSGTPTGGM